MVLAKSVFMNIVILEGDCLMVGLTAAEEEASPKTRLTDGSSRMDYGEDELVELDLDGEQQLLRGLGASAALLRLRSLERVRQRRPRHMGRRRRQTVEGDGGAEIDEVAAQQRVRTGGGSASARLSPGIAAACVASSAEATGSGMVWPFLLRAASSTAHARPPLPARWERRCGRGWFLGRGRLREGRRRWGVSCPVTGVPEISRNNLRVSAKMDQNGN